MTEETHELAGIPRPPWMNKKEYWLGIKGDGYSNELRDFYYKNNQLFSFWSPNDTETIFTGTHTGGKTWVSKNKVLDNFVMWVK